MEYVVQKRGWFDLKVGEQFRWRQQVRHCGCLHGVIYGVPVLLLQCLSGGWERCYSLRRMSINWLSVSVICPCTRKLWMTESNGPR